MNAKCVMVLGTTSGAGKSWLTTALCRHYARQGLKVAPFKAQNMSNNARVVAPMLAAAAWSQGGEIGSAQYFQSLAARAVPDVRMNPLLLKPERDTHSQVVLLGQVDEALSNMAWRDRSAIVWPVIAQALDELRAENDVVVIEGAGSPAEINLAGSDIVNMRVALHCGAACLLVTDIDRGGAFAHLYGTWSLLPEHQRVLIKGYVLNKFRGDTSLLAPAPQMLQDLTGVPTVATLPMWWRHGLPEEDGVFDDRSTYLAPTLVTSCTALDEPMPEATSLRSVPPCAGRPGAADLSPEGANSPRGGPSENCPAPRPLFQTIAVIAYPRISNLDEFQPLKNTPGVRLQWVRSPAELAGLAPSDWIILPGSKNTRGDLAWLRQQGLDAAIGQHAARGGAVLGICGGLQMLGAALIDPHGIEDAYLGNAPGLGLLPLVTVFETEKTVRHRQAHFHVGKQVSNSEHSPWAALAGVEVAGYEIHHGQTQQHPAMAKDGDIAQAIMPDGLAWQNKAGNVMGLYLHGLFEDGAALQALFGKSLSGPVPTLDSVFDGLADYIEQHFEPGVLAALIA